jgi:hypothetical protein
VLAALNGIDLRSLDLAEVFASRSKLALDGLLRHESPFGAAPLTFPYGPGARYVHHALALGGRDAVQSLFASPPRTTQQVLALDTSASADPVDFAPLPIALPEKRIGQDRLGALGVRMFGRAENSERTADLVKAFRGDALALYKGPHGGAALWRLAFADPASANGFIDLVNARRLTGHWRALRDAEGHPAVVVADTSEGLDALIGLLAPPTR